MIKIYTRSGDKGKTRIFGGERIDKDDIRIEANGCLDELNSMIGVVRAYLDPEHEWQLFLFRVQREMMILMSLVATPSELRETNPNRMDSNMIGDCEFLIDRLTMEMGESKTFILPGGNLVSAHLQLARAIIRRAERRLWSLNKVDKLPDEVMQFVNRLSDLFFTMARYELLSKGNPEEKWKDFLYKRN